MYEQTHFLITMIILIYNSSSHTAKKLICATTLIRWNVFDLLQVKHKYSTLRDVIYVWPLNLQLVKMATMTCMYLQCDVTSSYNNPELTAVRVDLLARINWSEQTICTAVDPRWSSGLSRQIIVDEEGRGFEPRRELI